MMTSHRQLSCLPGLLLLLTTAACGGGAQTTEPEQTAIEQVDRTSARFAYDGAPAHAVVADGRGRTWTLT